MINLLNNSQGTSSFININVKVEGLSNFDMIYVYHLLSEGTKLVLEKQGSTLSGGSIYDVYFNTFKLGYISLNEFSNLIVSNSININVIISKISKEKYLPIKSLDILLESIPLKNAS
jgi:hypothetical protein